MKKSIVYFFTGLLAFYLNAALAYEPTTHEKMSERSFDVSVLKKDDKILKQLGLKSLEEKEEFPNSKGNKKTIAQLFRDGANFEDSHLRPINHFFDPLSGDTLLPLVAKPSPSWALEDKGTIVFPLLQSYSFADARDYLYKALTLADETERKKHFGLTFETLGRVIHHIQDMAQPQHVRLDAHLKLSDADTPDWFFEKGSRYETYTRSLGDNLPFNTYAPINGKNDTNYLTTARSFWHTGQGGGMGLAEFTNRNFVSAATNFRGVFQNGGIAARANERYPLPSPSPLTPRYEDANSLLTSIGMTPPAECTPPNNPCVMAFFATEVADNYRQTSQVNHRASTASIFDQDLQLYGKTVSYPNLDKCTDPNNTATCEQIETAQIFSLNSFNFDETHKFLIPRAVAYSAGLIDYFFRGKLSAEDVTFTDTGISLRVKNAIDPVKTPAWANETLYTHGAQSPSTLTLAYEYKDATGKTKYAASPAVPLTPEPGGVSGIGPGQTSQNVYAFTLSVPAEAREVGYRLIFRGKMGQEENAVAVGNIEPLSGFIVNPNYVPTDGIGGSRLIEKRGGPWALSDKKDLLAGNVDWKGAYRNGRPTKVLSWSGPRSRYFPDNRDWRRAEIYREGKVFDYAPNMVLAAAVARDFAGVEWIVVICQEELQDVVYRRLATKNNPPDPREAWQLIARLDATQDDAQENVITARADIPWFFNGNGTEAQTLRSWRANNQPDRNQRKRLKITIDNTLTTARLDNLGNLDGFQEAYTCSGGYDQHGGGSVQSQFRGRGSYIIAVDYKNDQEVLAKVRLDANHNASTTVTAYEQSKYFYVQTGQINVDQSWVEYFEWGGQEQIHYSDKKKYNTTWSTISPPRQDQTGSIEVRWKNYLYGLDLRDDVYAYTYWNVDHQNEWNTDGLDNRTGNWTEGGEILARQRSPVLFTEPTSFASTTNMEILGARGCGQAFSSTRYGSLDFSEPSLLGALAVDTGGHIAASFFYHDIANNQIRGPINYLSEGSLIEIIPGAPAAPEYHPIGVVY